MRRSPARTMRALALFAVALFATACGLTPQHKADIHAFSRSAVALADIGRDEFIASRNDVVEMNRRRYLLGDPTMQPDALDGFMTIERIEERLAALDALADYGQALAVLLGTADKAELQTAANSLVGGLAEIDALAPDSEVAGLISGAITSVSGIFVEAKRRAAIEDVVELVHADIMEIADLIASEFDVVNGEWALAYQLTGSELRGVIIDANGTPSSGALRSSRLAVEEGRRSFERLALRVQDAADQLAAAQINLLESLENDKVNRLEIQALRQTITELTTTRDILGADRPAPTRTTRPTDSARRR